MEKQYIGDGAYAEVDNARQAVILTTENGITIQNTVVLEAEVLWSFLDYLQAAGIIHWRKHSQ